MKSYTTTLILILALNSAVANVSVNSNPGLPAALGVQAQVVTMEKDQGSFINHFYYPGPNAGDYVGGSQVYSVYVDNAPGGVPDGRGIFRAQGTSDYNGNLSLRAEASVASDPGNDNSAGAARLMMVESITNTTNVPIVRTFNLEFEAEVLQNGFETSAFAEIWAFNNDPGFSFTDPYNQLQYWKQTGVLGETVSYQFDGLINDVFTSFQSGKTTMSFTASTGSDPFALLSSLVVPLDPGETFYLLTTVEALADEGGSFVDAWGTLTISVDDPTGLDFGLQPVPEARNYAMLIGLAVFGLAALGRRRS